MHFIMITSTIRENDMQNSLFNVLLLSEPLCNRLINCTEAQRGTEHLNHEEVICSDGVI